MRNGSDELSRCALVNVSFAFISLMVSIFLAIFRAFSLGNSHLAIPCGKNHAISSKNPLTIKEINAKLTFLITQVVTQWCQFKKHPYISSLLRSRYKWVSLQAKRGVSTQRRKDAKTQRRDIVVKCSPAHLFAPLRSILLLNLAL